ncbi:MAG: hypothetical protein KTR31_02255 [Myxococcales bacterium]|nr:hypothetical protein [Myxococcales bacterium]
MALWVPATEVDPLAEHQPEQWACPLGSVLQEGLTVEVNTGLCSYAFYSQPLLAELSPGDRVEVVMWHNDLVAKGPAEGHIALLTGTDVLWERTIPIPADPCSYTDVVEVSDAVEAGTPLLLHVHNHGANSWNLFRVQRVEPDAVAAYAEGCVR